MLSTAAFTLVRSGRFEPSIGVGTAMMNTSAGWGFVEVTSDPLDTTFCTRPSRSGSAMWMAPDATVRTTSSLVSIPTTCMPRLAISAAVGKPMYPSPMTATF
jgi:hypothetical protein